MSMTTEKQSAPRAKYGAAAYEGLQGVLPTPFPRTMGPNATKYLQEIVDGGLNSDMTDRFEKAFAEALGVKHCISTPGCTPALAVLASAFDWQPGDEIIVSPISDYGTLQGLIREKYIPVFADVEPGTPNISARTVAECISPRTRAVLAVHKTGLPCDMDGINALARQHGLFVYEDVCQAVFSEYKGRIAGTLANAAAFSFDSEKTMGSDTGGCIVTDDDELNERARFIGHSRGAIVEPGFGRVHTHEGYAHRMPLCTAAVTLAQLEIVRENVEQRDRMARYLTRLLGEIPGIIPIVIPDYVTRYSCWMYGFNIDPAQFGCTPTEFGQQVARGGISGAGTAEYYNMPAALRFLQDRAQDHVYPYSAPFALREYSYDSQTCPNARDFLATFIRWVTFCEKYTEEHCEMVAGIVGDVAARNRK